MTHHYKYTLLVIIGLIILSSFKFQNKEKMLFHKIRHTASSVELIEWNTKDTINSAFVKEIVDEKGRTKELRFYNYAHQLEWAGSGFYGGPIIKYDYEENKIIETFFSAKNEIANDFKTSEVPYRHIYFLNKQNRIIDVKPLYKIDFDWTLEGLEETIEHLEIYKQYPDDGFELNNIFGYNYAQAKMNGINPELKK